MDATWVRELRRLHEENFFCDWTSHLRDLNHRLQIVGPDEFTVPNAGLRLSWFVGDVEDLQPGRWVLVVSLNQGRWSPRTRVARRKQRGSVQKDWGYWRWLNRTDWYGRLYADGSRMAVRDALALINATLDEVLAEQEGDFDADTRWAVTWSEQFGYDEGEYGVAEQLSKAKNTSVDGLVWAGIIESRRGAVRIFRPAELDEGWDPATDTRLTVWEMMQHLVRLLESGGEPAAGELAAKLGSQAEGARDLACRLYVVSERKRRVADALAYNGLVQWWPEIVRLAGEQRAMAATQGALAIDGA